MSGLVSIVVLAVSSLAAEAPTKSALEAETPVPSTPAAQAAETASEQTDSLEIRFVGNAGFELYDGETTLFVDLPYRSGAYNTMRYDPKTLRPRGNVVCLITHSHVDHWDARPFQRADWKIIAPAALTKPIPKERIIPLKFGIPVGDFVVAPYETPHAGLEHYAFVVSWKGRKLYFSGDTDDPTNLLKMTKLDIAFITPWLSCKAAASEDSIETKRIVLQHHRVDGSDDACQEVTIMEQGEVIKLTPDEDYEGES